ncbi:MAG: KamA family radical SAM protein [Tissierellia bacterium]|nr:KamA family radical SAM protein [Tissierellia bacterium]
MTAKVPHWKEDLKKNLSSLDDLKKKLPLDPEGLGPVLDQSPMNITDYYLSLMDPSDPQDPIGKMALPSLEELSPEGVFDTSGEGDNTKLAGVQHKYRQTALVLSTNICFMYCRHCFRKRLVGTTQDEIIDRLDQALDYIGSHPEIDNVLITGGDALTLSNENIARYLRALSALDQLDFIRFGSRIPVVFPQRIYEDPELLDLLKTYNQKKRILLVTQFNHPREITQKAIKAIQALKDQRIDVFNQTVLLKGVNDHPDTLAQLMKSLSRQRMVPYYIFQCRPVKHVKNHFQVPLTRGVDIINETKNRLNGPAKHFRYALSHPRGKIEILGKLEDQMVFKFQQAKNPEDASQIFLRKLGPQDSWFDQDLNPIK